MRDTDRIIEAQTRPMKVPFGAVEFQKVLDNYLQRNITRPTQVIVGSKTYLDICQHIRQSTTEEGTANNYMYYMDYLLIVDPEQLYRVTPTGYPPVVDRTPE